jgi:hypothetical protein
MIRFRLIGWRTILPVAGLCLVSFAEAQPSSMRPGTMTPGGVASARASSAVGAGMIRVSVVDGDSSPVPGADVVLISLEIGGARRETRKKTDEKGVCTFTNQATGDKQSYLVSQPGREVRYRSPPFRLPETMGYEVTIRRTGTTLDTSRIVISNGQLSVVPGEKRLRIDMTLRLVNMDRRTCLFPERGLPVRLPREFTAFRAPRVMSDLRVAEHPGRGVAIRGSIPPGAATVRWGFDLPVSRTETRFRLELPLKTMAFRVIVDATADLSLDVEGMPKSVPRFDEGRRLLQTESKRKPGEPPLRRISVVIGGIPGPGPLRWVAAALSIIFLGIGIAFALRSDRGKRDGNRLAGPGVEALLDRAMEIEAGYRSGSIDSERYATERETILSSLTEALRSEASGSAPRST